MCMIIHFSHSHLCWNAKPTWFHHQHTSQPRHILLLTYFGQKLKGVLYGNVNNPNQSSNDKIQGFPGTKQTSVRTDHLRSTCTLISRPYFGPRSMPQQIIVTNVTSRAPLLFKFWFVFKASVYPNHKKNIFSLRSSVNNKSKFWDICCPVPSLNVSSQHNGAERNLTCGAAVLKNGI